MLRTLFYKCNKVSKYIFRVLITKYARMRNPSLFEVSSSPKNTVISPYAVSFFMDKYSLQDALPNLPFVKQTINNFVAIKTIKVVPI